MLLLVAPFAWALAEHCRGKALAFVAHCCRSRATSLHLEARSTKLPLPEGTAAVCAAAQLALRHGMAAVQLGCHLFVQPPSLPYATAAVQLGCHLFGCLTATRPPPLRAAPPSLQKAAKHYNDAIFLKFFGEFVLFYLSGARHCSCCCCCCCAAAAALLPLPLLLLLLLTAQWSCCCCRCCCCCCCCYDGACASGSWKAEEMRGWTAGGSRAPHSPMALCQSGLVRGGA